MARSALAKKYNIDTGDPKMDDLIAREQARRDSMATIGGQMRRASPTPADYRYAETALGYRPFGMANIIDSVLLGGARESIARSKANIGEVRSRRPRRKK